MSEKPNFFRKRMQNPLWILPPPLCSMFSHDVNSAEFQIHIKKKLKNLDSLNSSKLNYFKIVSMYHVGWQAVPYSANVTFSFLYQFLYCMSHTSVPVWLVEESDLGGQREVREFLPCARGASPFTSLHRGWRFAALLHPTLDTISTTPLHLYTLIWNTIRNPSRHFWVPDHCYGGPAYHYVSLYRCIIRW